LLTPEEIWGHSIAEPEQSCPNCGENYALGILGDEEYARWAEFLDLEWTEHSDIIYCLNCPTIYRVIYHEDDLPTREDLTLYIKSVTGLKEIL